MSTPNTDVTDTEQARRVRQRLDGYLDTGLAAVQGWFSPESARVVATLLAHQVATGIAGDVAEIGVHHGKSFLLIANGVRSDERATALDVFGQQEKNVDNSGRGDRAIFESNAAAHAPDADINILEMSSLDVTPDTAGQVFGRVRLMSVDGGHTAGITRHDLELAEACLVPDGVVVLDDVLNAHWLGVATGLFEFLAGPTELTAFAFSENKLYLARPQAAADYAALLRREQADLLGKQDVEFYGGTLDVYGQGSPYRQRARDTAGRQAKDAQAEVNALRASLRRAEKRVQDMQASRSWRITASIRRLSGQARGRG